jgi:anaerobic magnesium-protoporphyrin IX monomethyl ester cyclase
MNIKAMRVLFLNPNWNLLPARMFPGCKRPHQPLELLYPATMLTTAHHVKVVDAFLERLDDGQLQQLIKSFNPDVVVMTTAPSYLFWRCCPLDISLPKSASSLIRHCCQASLILIGPHPTVSPEWVMEECDADYLIRGEAEISLAEFINSNLEDEHVKGVFSRKLDNGFAVVDDLSLLPIVDFGMLPYGGYHSHSPKYKTGVSIEFSRGCAFQCSFCFRQFFRNRYRMRPSEKVIAEVKAVKSLGYQYIYFIDELFNRDSQDLRKLLTSLAELGIAWGCQCRPDIMKPDLLKSMKEAGCEDIEYGLETLNPEISKSMKKNMNNERSLISINATAEIGIKTTVFFLYGAPEETQDTLKETFGLLDKLDRRVYFSSGLLIPYPTTPVFQGAFGIKDCIGRDDWEKSRNLAGKMSAIPREDLEKIVIISHISNHLRNLRLPKILISFSTYLLGVLPAAVFSQSFGILLSIRKERDIQ